MKHIKIFNERSKKLTPFFMVTASLVLTATLGFFINNVFDLQAAPNFGHDAEKVGPGTFNEGISGTWTWPAGSSLCIDTSCINNWPSAGDSDWIISGSDMYSGVAGNVGIGDDTPGEGKVVVRSTTGNGVYSHGVTTGYWGGSTTGNGIFATSDSGAGVWGGSMSSDGIHGTSSTGNGVYGLSASASGVYGDGVYGVYGTGSTYGIYGNSASNIGVHGVGGNAGVDGYGTNYGIFGSSGNTGVYASGAVYDFYASGAGIDYGTSSSIRWKENIKPIDNALENVLALQGVYYDWKEDYGGQHGMGMIAEEVGKIIPEIVSYEENGVDATGIDYGHLTPVLVEAIKEQQKQIEKLQEEIEILKLK